MWHIDGTSQSLPESNGNEGVLHTAEISRNGAWQSDAIYCNIQKYPLF